MLIGNIDELKTKPVQCIHLDHLSFVLIYQAGQFYLLDNLCPHKAAALCEGKIIDDEIECPWHKARFNIKTGHSFSTLASKGVRSWPVSVENGQLMVELNPL